MPGTHAALLRPETKRRALTLVWLPYDGRYQILGQFASDIFLTSPLKYSGYNNYNTLITILRVLALSETVGAAEMCTR